MNEHDQMNIISLSDAITKSNMDIELLQKIRFLITNNSINPELTKIDITTGVFYDEQLGESYEVNKNNDTNEYFITKVNNQTFQNSQQQTKNNIKVRRLVKPDMNNAAFTKIGFLLINILTFTTLITMMLLLKK